jgi:hypothetical protein
MIFFYILGFTVYDVHVGSGHAVQGPRGGMDHLLPILHHVIHQY